MPTFVFYSLLLSLLSILASCQSEPSADHLLLSQATQAFHQGDYVLAETLFTQVLQTTDDSGIPQEKTASARYHLGEIYRLQGKWVEAERQLWRALPIWAKTVGPTHPSMAKGLTSLALVYEARHEYKKAEPLVKQALKIREIAYGKDHPKIVTSLEQYAALLNQLNRSEEADIFLSRGRIIITKQQSSNRNPNR